LYIQSIDHLKTLRLRGVTHVVIIEQEDKDKNPDAVCAFARQYGAYAFEGEDLFFVQFESPRNGKILEVSHVWLMENMGKQLSKLPVAA
jgi:hypothetical protein